MSVKRNIAGNTLAQIGGKAAATAIGLATVALMTRHLGLEGYGEFTTALAFLQMFAILAGFGLPITLAKLISKEGANERRILANAFAMRLTSAAVIFAAAPLVGLLFPYSAEVKVAIAVGALSFLGLTLHEMLVAVFQRHLSTWKVAVSEVVGRTALLAGTAWAVLTGRGLITIVAALAAGNLLQFVLSYSMARRMTPIGLSFERKIWKDIFRETWPIGVAVMFNLIYLKGDVILLSMMRTQAEVGLYGAAYKVLDVVTVIPYVFMGLVLPLMSAAWSRGDRKDFNRKLSMAFDFLSMLAIPLMFGAAAVASDLMALVAGEDFAASGGILAVLMVGALAVFWHATYSNALVAMGQQRKMVAYYAVNAAVSVGLYLALIPRIGTMGAAGVTAFSELFIAIAVTAIVTRSTGFSPNFFQLGRVIIASVGMGLLLMTMPDTHVMLRVLAGVAAFFAGLTAIGGLRASTVRSLISRRT